MLRGQLELSISEAQFKEIYAGTDADISLFYRQPATDLEYRDYATSKLWRMNNWYTIIDKDGIKVWFKMNLAQHKAYAAQLRHPRNIFLKSRQRGISTFFLINYFDDAICLDNLTVGMQSYGLEESAALLEKLTVAWVELADANKDLLEIERVKSNTKAIGFSNGSEIKVATSFRGTTLHRLHVSELGKIAAKDPKKARELATGTLQAIKAGNPVAIESTAEGQHNAFHAWWYKAVDVVGIRSLKDFAPVFLSWVDDPDCVGGVVKSVNDDYAVELQVIEEEWADYMGLEEFKLDEEQRSWFVSARDELDDDFYQEYPHTPDAAFSAVKDGTYYARPWRRLVKADARRVSPGKLYEPYLPVHVAWDLGMNDTMSLVMFQVFANEVRVVDEYHNSGEGLEHYVEVLKEREYSYGAMILPHDAKVRELGIGKSRVKRLAELGVRKNVQVLPRSTSVLTDIEYVRKMLPKLWVDGQKASYIVKTLGRYSKKWDDVLGAYKEKPLHNEWSNPADALRYMMLSNVVRKGIVVDATEAIKRTAGQGSRLRSNVVGGLAMF